MKTIHKLLAVLLAGLMLIGFGVGAGAETEEEREARGRALLIQFMEDLRGDYTFRASSYSISGQLVHSNGNYAIDRDDGTRELILKDGVFRVFPNHNAYQILESSNYSYVMHLLEPKEITESTLINVSSWTDGTLIARCENISYGFNYFGTKDRYNIQNGMFPFSIFNFHKGADLSLFSLDGMREVSEQQVWLWDFPIRWQEFRDDRNSVLGMMLWGLMDTLIHAPIILPLFIPLLPFFLIAGIVQWLISFFTIVF